MLKYPERISFRGKCRIHPKIFPWAGTAEIFSVAPDVLYLKRWVSFSTLTGAPCCIIRQVYFLKTTCQAQNAWNKGFVEWYAITVCLEIFSNEHFYTLWLNCWLLVVHPTFTCLADILAHYRDRYGQYYGMMYIFFILNFINTCTSIILWFIPTINLRDLFFQLNKNPIFVSI